MPVKKPAPGELDAIETASRDEITAVQLQRLQATLRRAYDHVAHYRQAFDAKGVHPDDLKSLADLAKLCHFSVLSGIKFNSTGQCAKLRRPRPTTSPREWATRASSSRLIEGSIWTLRSGLKYSTGTLSFSAKNWAVYGMIEAPPERNSR